MTDPLSSGTNRHQTTDSRPKRSRKHCALKPAKKGTRECYVTLLHDVTNGVDLVIGAGTKAECIKAFQRISPGTPHDPKLVYRAVWRKVKKS